MGGFGTFFVWCLRHPFELIMLGLALSYFYYLGTLVWDWLMQSIAAIF